MAEPLRLRAGMTATSVDYENRHVVVTGGTGALGTAVTAALLEAGAICHLPYRSAAALDRFPHREHRRVSLVAVGELADEAEVMRFYGGLQQLWASIHLAGAYAPAPLAQSDKALLMSQLETNLVSAYVCSRAAALAMRRAGAG